MSAILYYSGIPSEAWVKFFHYDIYLYTYIYPIRLCVALSSVHFAHACVASYSVHYYPHEPT